MEGFHFVTLVFPGFMMLQKPACSYQRYCSEQGSVLTMKCIRKKQPFTDILDGKPIILLKLKTAILVKEKTIGGFSCHTEIIAQCIYIYIMVCSVKNTINWQNAYCLFSSTLCVHNSHYPVIDICLYLIELIPNERILFIFYWTLRCFF